MYYAEGLWCRSDLKWFAAQARQGCKLRNIICTIIGELHTNIDHTTLAHSANRASEAALPFNRFASDYISQWTHQKCCYMRLCQEDTHYPSSECP